MDNLKKFKKISILQGGISDESKISKLSAKEVFLTLKKKYDVSLIDVDDDLDDLILKLKKANSDIYFNCLHGFFGEDGQIQSILNALKLEYTHSGVLSSSISMNKQLAKAFFGLYGVNTPKGGFLNDLESKNNFNFPMIVKPNCGGSSNRLYKIDNSEQLKKFEKEKHSNEFIYEEFIKGREITVGILNNELCGIMEIIFDSELYDYNNKYLSVAKHIINPELPNDIIQMLNENSVLIHNKLNCNCISRLDFRYDENNEKLFLLEINTQPGLTKHSLLPEMARNKGISFTELCEIILNHSICPK